jgi:hypothetical protein
MRRCAAPSAGAASIPSLPNGASVLFALEARSGSFTRVPGRADHYTLVLRGVARRTTWFSDRPQREAGRIRTGSLLGSWRDLGFAEEPPNAAVALDDGRRARDTVAMELRLRSRDNGRRTARFRVRVLKGLGPVSRRASGSSRRAEPRNGPQKAHPWRGVCMAGPAGSVLALASARPGSARSMPQAASRRTAA